MAIVFQRDPVTGPETDKRILAAGGRGDCEPKRVVRELEDRLGENRGGRLPLVATHRRRVGPSVAVQVGSQDKKVRAGAATRRSAGQMNAVSQQPWISAKIAWPRRQRRRTRKSKCG
jgi:hypothetical protein